LAAGSGNGGVDLVVDEQRRKELIENARRQRPPAGVYRIVNRETGKALLGSSVNLDGFRNRVEFARSTNTAGGVDHRLHADIATYGFDAFEFEVLDVLEVGEGATDRDIAADVTALEALWRERYEPAELY
jgi:hypothetical protein